MPDRLTIDTIDAELVPGARNAIRVCLQLKPQERITIITDEATRDIAAALQAEVTEDLLHVRHLAVLPLGRRDDRLIPALRAQLPNAALIALPQAASAAKARAAIGTFFADPIKFRQSP